MSAEEIVTLAMYIFAILAILAWARRRIAEARAEAEFYRGWAHTFQGMIRRRRRRRLSPVRRGRRRTGGIDK